MVIHPSKKIIGEISSELLNKKILVGVTGSVSIYKTIDLVRSLMRLSAEVQVIMSRDASKLVSPTMFEWATGNPVITKISGGIEHVTLAEDYDAYVIAPATANTISKIANGIADTPITVTALNFIGLKKPLILVPAMHLPMYFSPQMINNINKLKEMGVIVIEPFLVRDVAHYPDIEYLSNYISTILLRGKDLEGLKIVVTAGPTREHLDPVRFISNPSSGTMGVAIANEAYFRGADVVLVHGPLSTHIKPYVKKKVQVETTDEMANEVKKFVESGYNIVILAGAPADYKFKNTASSKIDSHTETPSVELEKTVKISSIIRKYSVFLVGFAAETVKDDNELIEKGKIKKERHGFDLLIANNASRNDIGFSSEYNEVIVIGNNFIKKINKNYKTVIAREILDIVKQEYKVQKHG
ncbi:bifunctional phosphopantothenoylcysteine decarboxylase/phosphopantothenate--cysteine ligase CoaBC [Sulfolobus sp. S-194]|uniref:bifunctional phosphopantothenoylcysteine decarboxylase/phosphopantothenate--cysteine ligase CoaBC n=1 Tax=Sulfolobus sp. S-194 TaxID=2512240 RepID=UPI001436E2AD|nr:bifunctional phosphopantothenoylcysteine decarboxylase/phosphopantothenate--cysteine ligase CoaBC [Sulfolobus sp. S-194]QIW23091.1 bifunctional phosphopantothenoylcysteine decarboxylase/phosphopantothenate--cysteine ligase CoaBC [Sulfolobus sp. S-194]